MQFTRKRRKQRKQQSTRISASTRKLHPRKKKLSDGVIPKYTLFPQQKSKHSFYFKVSSLHSIYVELYGNMSGKPVLFVHGGPGGGTTPAMSRFFDPAKYMVVLVDQRGCGKSKPSAELKQNTTSHLIDDFEKIRQHLHVSKWMLFGGSWGSTLCLAYAFAHPHVVSEIVLRGIFTCSSEEIDWIAEPHGGAKYIRPDAWNFYKNTLMSLFKNKKKQQARKLLFMKEYGNCFRGKWGKKNRDKCLLAWNVWEASLSNLHMKPLQHIIKEAKHELSRSANSVAQMSLIEHHYFTSKCFINPSAFLSPRNTKRIQHIPITIVQGIYDMVCPFYTAYRLHAALPHAKFFPTMAGHSAFDKENIRHLVAATEYYARSSS